MELMTVIMAVTFHAFHTKEERHLMMLSKMEVATKATCGLSWMNCQCQGGAMLRAPSGLIYVELTHCCQGKVVGQLLKLLELMWKFETS